MNRSPDMSRAELAAEEQVTAAECQLDNPDLAADRALRHELRSLGAPSMPPALRSRVMSAAHRPHQPAWWIGLAAAVVVGLAVALIIEPTARDTRPPAVADADLHDLQLALAGLELGARRAGSVTGRELAQTFATTRIDLDEVPYANQLGRWIQPQTSNHH